MKNVKAKVAAGATVICLGGLGGVALSQGGQAPSTPVADRPLVQTKVIHRTIHVTKHAKPKHPPAAAPVEPASASAPVTTGSSGAAGGSESDPVSTGSSSTGTETEAVTTGSSSTGAASAPVSTGSSGTGGGGGEAEHESEGGDD